MKILKLPATAPYCLHAHTSSVAQDVEVPQPQLAPECSSINDACIIWFYMVLISLYAISPGDDTPIILAFL